MRNGSHGRRSIAGVDLSLSRVRWIRAGARIREGTCDVRWTDATCIDRALAARDGMFA